MYSNRITAALQDHSLPVPEIPRTYPDPSAFVVFPGAWMPAAFHLELYQLSYERAQAALQQQNAPTRRLVFSLN